MPEPTTSVTTTSTYIAVLVSEAVVPVGAKASSEVFISLVDIDAQVDQFEIHLLFDPKTVQVAGEQAPQVVTVESVEVKQVDNAKGSIVLILRQRDELLLKDASGWLKIAAITWTARQEGKSLVAFDTDTRFYTSDGQTLSPDATYDGVVFARAPGTILGTATLQGRENHEGIAVSSSLSSTRLDRQFTDEEGQFAIATSHGEGFYTVVVSMPGYLSAESSRPIKVTVDSIVDVGRVTLQGGDVNGDNEVDIRDLAYVAWHFDKYDDKADINGDGQVDILDLTLTAGNFGETGPTLWDVSGTSDE